MQERAVITILLSLVLQVYALEYNCDTDIISTYNNHTTRFHSIQDALDDAASQNHSHQEIPLICLPPHSYNVTRPLRFGSLSLRLVGSKNRTTIVCNYDTEQLAKNGIDYTWHFNQSKQLYLSSIVFLDCPYPFRMIAVESVTVKECTFR